MLFSLQLKLKTLNFLNSMQRQFIPTQQWQVLHFVEEIQPVECLSITEINGQVYLEHLELSMPVTTNIMKKLVVVLD